MARSLELVGREGGREGGRGGGGGGGGWAREERRRDLTNIFFSFQMARDSKTPCLSNC